MTTTLTPILKKIIERLDLSPEDMTQAMKIILAGQSSPEQLAGFLVALQVKGESVTEITAAVQVMRERVTPVTLNREHLVDIVGTGGDNQNTFNVSTASAFVVAAAGGCVAKHGNRSVSSGCGSADVLEAAGISLALTPAQVATCVDQLGIGFMFAPKHHLAMKHVAAVRKALGIRTLFNLLGPLTNPAGAKHHLIGVFHKKWLRPFAETLINLGSIHGLVVHAEDGLDEISVAAPTHVVEFNKGNLKEYVIEPETFGLTKQSLQTCRVNNAEQSLQLLRQVFANQPGAPRDMVILNSGAAIYAADLVDNFEAGITLAKDVLASGRAAEKFERLKQLTQDIT